MPQVCPHPSFGPHLPESNDNFNPILSTQKQTIKTTVHQNPLTALAHYGSDSEDEDSDEEMTKEDVEEPPEDLKIIIDKMAAYVSKNGADFEAIVKSKGDPRFEFLHAGHDHHAYYKFKLAELGIRGSKSREKSKRSPSGSEKEKEQNGVISKPKERKVIGEFLFSFLNIN